MGSHHNQVNDLHFINITVKVSDKELLGQHVRANLDCIFYGTHPSLAQIHCRITPTQNGIWLVHVTEEPRQPSLHVVQLLSMTLQNHTQVRCRTASTRAVSILYDRSHKIHCKMPGGRYRACPINHRDHALLCQNTNHSWTGFELKSALFDNLRGRM